MTVTVWGELGGPGTHAANRDIYGRMTEAHSYRELDLELPAEGVTVDADHDGRRLGELLFVELGEDERLRAVCTIDGDWLMDIDQPVYFSPQLQMRGRNIENVDAYIARVGSLIGLSLTFATARLGAHPVRVQQGDLRDPVDRYSWPCSWRSDALLDRALDALGSGQQMRTRSAPMRIVDRRRGDLDRFVGRNAASLHPAELELLHSENQRPVGQLRHSTPVRGSVLRVR